MSSAALILESNEPSEPERLGNVSSEPPRPLSDENGEASPIDDDDMAIVLALRRGESGAAEALFRRLVPFVRRTLWRILRNPAADCDDLIQITFERIINTLIDGRYRGACSLPRWAMSIASHAAVDHHRARCRERKLLDAEMERSFDGGAPPTADAERSLIARSELVRLEDTLSRMRPLDAQALMLRHGFGFSLAETAAALGTSEYAVASRLARARRELSRRTSHFHDGE
jgi:RNA polymerase sigma-70 factor (ECF subfamily)